MNIFKKLLLSIQFIGLPDTLRIIHSSLLRDWYERRFRESSPEHTFHAPGELLDAELTSQGGRFTFANTELEIRFLTPSMVRVSWRLGQLPLLYAIAKTAWPEVDVSSSETDVGGYKLSSGELTVLVWPEGTITYHDKGVQLRAEYPPQWRGGGWSQWASLDADEKIYGLGERAARLNLRNHPHKSTASHEKKHHHGPKITYQIQNEDPGGHYATGDDPLYLNIPLYLSRKRQGAYLLFYENTHQGEFSLEEEKVTIGFKGGMPRYYFIAGKPAKAMESYTKLTGRAPLPPRWALGYHQCRWGYQSAQDIREVAAGFKARDLPLDAIHLDIDYMDGFRVFTINEERFPDLASLSAALKEEGIHTVTILDPGVKIDREYTLYQEGVERGLFCATPAEKPITAQVWPGMCHFPDFTNPETRVWWGKQYPKLLKMGIDGFWHDMNEPAAFVGWGNPTLPAISRYSMEGRSGNHTEANNIYGLMMNQAGYEALRKFTPKKRPWLLSRAGWAGMQRYAWNWTGDVSTSWSTLRQTLITMLGIGLSGIPYTGSDIGGFSGHPSAELFTRWFQMAAFTPFFRGHSATSTPRREPWVYGEPTTTIVRNFLNLRRRLTPYLYTLAWEASQSGAPLMRPLFWEFPTMGDVEDQFMLGDSLLVAPVLEEGEKNRRVTLPPGVWYSWWDGAAWKGGVQREVEVTLNRIPLFTRAGSVIPLVDGNILTLRVSPPFAGQNTFPHNNLFSDAGEGYGPHRVDTFAFSKVGEDHLLRMTGRGEYPFPYEEVAVEAQGESAVRLALG